MGDDLRLDRIQGCLLGGAVGDALGWPVEFVRLDRILEAHGPAGVIDLTLRVGGLAEVTDDTQMTLFTAEGLLLAKDLGAEEVVGAVHAAYQRWFLTQRLSGPTADAVDAEGTLLREGWLYASRAPGNACMSGVVENPRVPTIVAMGRTGAVNPDSKGCGTVMRSAPFGLAGVGPEEAFRLAADCAQLTHGHPTGYVAAGAFAALVDRLVGGVAPDEAVRLTIVQTAAQPGGEETVTALERAVRLAGSEEPGFDVVERVGLGWIAEECLAIAVYCLLAAASGATSTEDDLRRALTLSVTHSGDSDSTGAVCGNLLGAAHGLTALPRDWAGQVEGRETVLATGAALHARAMSAE
ncbi:ADP-ribosylglycohydrolase family protein [Streptacidiphilus carbonis]|uniref:ADP-ribosylglycohydrolase family protein n=1 Tax=Streptacidiphilus carbonis TaxID=105422 RepID=UPI0005A90175|nr:ADP-ribosylglycohydrolase family protein [Streptacidiphilus carbonis]